MRPVAGLTPPGLARRDAFAGVDEWHQEAAAYCWTRRRRTGAGLPSATPPGGLVAAESTCRPLAKRHRPTRPAGQGVSDAHQHQHQHQHQRHHWHERPARSAHRRARGVAARRRDRAQGVIVAYSDDGPARGSANVRLWSSRMGQRSGPATEPGWEAVACRPNLAPVSL